MCRTEAVVPPWPADVLLMRQQQFPSWYLASDEHFSDPRDSRIVEARNPDLIGYAWCFISRSNPSRAHLVELVVDPSARRNGLARQMLVELSMWLVELGVAELTTTALADDAFVARDRALADFGFARHREYDRIIDPAAISLR